ncbi:MAG: RsbRD N-terminal domain-containing protein, partial [Deltaproteobacteria bacterium]|nr:RsbRD N-terminal domain-containing protein [Deltaproteobacteria bacterium]
EIETLYDEIIRGEDPDRISSSLDTIIRIRAVQDFQPSGALAFVLQLKQIVREAVGASHGEEMETLDRRVDDTLLLAFDVYSACRQKLAEIRVNEVRNQVGRLLEKANLIKEIPDQSPAL